MTERLPEPRLVQGARAGRWHRPTRSRARGGKEGGKTKRLRKLLGGVTQKE